MEDLFGPVIYRYTREQAIEDGVLIDVSELAREAGILVPTVITSAVQSIISDIPKSMIGMQDEVGRLWDILSVFALKARASTGNTLFFTVIMPHGRYKRLELKSMIHGGDNGEAVITIMLPNED